MKLTKEQAIDRSIELWEWCAETGKEKEDWPEWDRFELETINDCFLCEYDIGFGDRDDWDNYCAQCPYFEKFGVCDNKGTVYSKWDYAKTPKSRKKYAKLFLEQLRSLK